MAVKTRRSFWNASEVKGLVHLRRLQGRPNEMNYRLGTDGK